MMGIVVGSKATHGRRGDVQNHRRRLIAWKREVAETAPRAKNSSPAGRPAFGVQSNILQA